MTRDDDFEDRIAARLLGVDLDASPAIIRSRFRRLVRAVHPDTSTSAACVDLGRLAEAKDRLVTRSTRLADRRRAEEAARTAARRRRLEDDARRRVAAMRADVHVIDLTDAAVARPVLDRRFIQARVTSPTRLGRLVDLAG